ncbi:hypothetical protein J3R30DRAFT_3716896 [Lentinula aciculospora]|uniref:Uncharacterized protein n=1 Tax=Lentinula aciculospora TaxID=153920 RepID=A0A9W8ZUX4_9AGAR|nr:hypothetical protein J3R30DRAFT_3716896 [Lentinula aciculospora]
MALAGVIGRDELRVETNSIIVFDVLNAIGLILTALALLPALLSATVSRTSTWKALMASSMVYSSSYLLLLPIGQRSVAQPEYGVCLFQASLVYSAPVFITFAGWAHVLQIYLGIVLNMLANKLWLLRINIMLLVTPVVVATFMFAVSLIVGVKHPDTIMIDSTRRYCHITTPLPHIITAVLVGIGTAGMMVFEVLVSVHLSTHWKSLREMSGGGISVFAWFRLGRIIVFTIFPFGAFALNIVGFFDSGSMNDKWNMLLPIMPLGAAFIFGSRTDIFRAWKVSYKTDSAWNIYEEPKPIPYVCLDCGKAFEFSSGTA